MTTAEQIAAEDFAEAGQVIASIELDIYDMATGASVSGIRGGLFWARREPDDEGGIYCAGQGRIDDTETGCAREDAEDTIALVWGVGSTWDLRWIEAEPREACATGDDGPHYPDCPGSPSAARGRHPVADSVRGSGPPPSVGSLPCRGRIPPLALEWRTPAELVDNPSQWKTHPPAQMAGFAAVMQRLEDLDDGDTSGGWAGAALYNLRTERLVDAHARKRLAEDRLVDGARVGRPGERVLPVLVGTWGASMKDAATPERRGRVSPPSPPRPRPPKIQAK